MKIGVLANPESWYLADLNRAADSLGYELLRVDYRQLLGDESTIRVGGETPLLLNNFDALIVRTMPPGSLEQVVFRMDALLQLDEAGVAVVNHPKAIECAVDKFLATAKLARAGIPVPATIACQSSDAAMESFEQLGGDVVVKPIFGAEGRGIVRVSDPDMAHRVFRTLERINAVLYLQAFIDHPGYDIRVLVLDGRVVGSIRRIAQDDFRTNVAQKATTEIHSPTGVECELAIRSATGVNARFAGVDILKDPSGDDFVIEVNAVPGWRAFTRTTGIDVADVFLRSLSGQR